MDIGGADLSRRSVKVSRCKSHKPVKTILKRLFPDTGIEVIDHGLYGWKFQVILKSCFIPEFFIGHEPCTVTIDLRKLIVDDAGLAAELRHGGMIDFLEVTLCTRF